MDDEKTTEQVRDLCKKQIIWALDERNPNPYPVVQTYLLSQILEKLEDIEARLNSIDNEIWVRGNG